MATSDPACKHREVPTVATPVNANNEYPFEIRLGSAWLTYDSLPELTADLKKRYGFANFDPSERSQLIQSSQLGASNESFQNLLIRRGADMKDLLLDSVVDELKHWYESRHDWAFETEHQGNGYEDSGSPLTGSYFRARKLPDGKIAFSIGSADRYGELTEHDAAMKRFARTARKSEALEYDAWPRFIFSMEVAADQHAALSALPLSRFTQTPASIEQPFNGTNREPVVRAFNYYLKFPTRIDVAGLIRRIEPVLGLSESSLASVSYSEIAAHNRELSEQKSHDKGLLLSDGDREIEIAISTFDPSCAVRLVNRSTWSVEQFAHWTLDREHPDASVLGIDRISVTIAISDTSLSVARATARAEAFAGTDLAHQQWQSPLQIGLTSVTDDVRTAVLGRLQNADPSDMGGKPIDSLKQLRIDPGFSM